MRRIPKRIVFKASRNNGQKAFPPARTDEYSPHELERISQACAAVTNYDRNLHDIREQLDRLDLIKSMAGIELEVFGFGRDHSAQRQGLKAEQKRNIEKFWQDYFKRARTSGLHMGRNLNL